MTARPPSAPMAPPPLAWVLAAAGQVWIVLGDFNVDARCVQMWLREVRRGRVVMTLRRASAPSSGLATLGEGTMVRSSPA